MIKTRLFFGVVLTLLSFKVDAQVLKFKEAEKLPSTVNSEAEESMPLICQDGNTMYFVRSFFKDNHGGKFSGQDIWMSKKDTSWLEATNQLKGINNKKNNAVIGIKDDGKTLYLLNSYGGTVHGIAFTKYINGKWTKPESIPVKGINKDGYIGFYMNPTYDVLLISMSGTDSYGKEDLFVCLKDSANRWSEPHNLGATINSSGFEISPYITNDNKYLFFSSNGHPGFGDADVFVSERLYNSWDIWSTPKNLGPEINSKNFDAFFTVTKDSTVYFASNRGNDNADLFSSKIVVPENSYSQERIDSLINEANNLINEIESGRNLKKRDFLVLFEPNKFELSESQKEEIDSLLSLTSDKQQVIISLLSFSYEDYSEESKKLMIGKREQIIRTYLSEKGISSLDIFSETDFQNSFKEYSEENIGGVRIRISY
ncbi:MAG: PD40 domain-containing protein [Cyclobacteriaceae bacterium]|nr:PD40 domain-containing protein [Cyclobacteriaceae bacterium]